MKRVLSDIRDAIDSIDKYYYSMEDVYMNDNEMVVDSEKIKNFERRFCIELYANFKCKIIDKLDLYYDNLRLDGEVPKKYIFTDNRDEDLYSTYQMLYEANSKRGFDEIHSIPDFIIHKGQDDNNELNQMLVVEVKTNPRLSRDDVWWDIFKLNIYVEKFNYQNAVFVVVNNDIEPVLSKVNSYLKHNLYSPPLNRDKIYIFLKPEFGAEIQIRRLGNIKEFEIPCM